MKRKKKYDRIIFTNLRGEFMHRFFGEQDAYGLFNLWSYYAIMISCLFFFKIKRKSMGLWSTYVIDFVSKWNKKLAVVVEYVLSCIEMILFAQVLDYTCGNLNRPFGDLVGTGANYFAVIFTIAVFWSIVSLVIRANPLKQLDMATFLIPVQLVFLKLACFFNGCCWGIPWEYGLYNYHPNHPGKQVPVQAIEILFALVIFILLLWYRKKAKPGTIYPMFMILYGGTRFFSEFFTAAYPDIIGPFNMYQILCTISVVIGVVLFFVVRKYNEKISDFFEKPYKKYEAEKTKKEDPTTEEVDEESVNLEA